MIGNTFYASVIADRDKALEYLDKKQKQELQKATPVVSPPVSLTQTPPADVKLLEHISRIEQQEHDKDLGLLLDIITKTTHEAPIISTELQDQKEFITDALKQTPNWLLEGEVSQEVSLHYLVGQWRSWQHGVLIVREKTNMALAFHIHEELQFDFTRNAFVSVPSVVAFKSGDWLAGIGDVAGGLVSMAPPPFNFIGAFLISTFWPKSGGSEYAALQKSFEEGLRRLREELYDQIDAIYATSCRNFVDSALGLVDYFKNTYPHTSTREQRQARLSGAERLAENILQNIPFLANAGSSVSALITSMAFYSQAAVIHIAALQELASCYKSLHGHHYQPFLDNIKTYVRVHAAHLRSVAEKALKLRLSYIEVHYTSVGAFPGRPDTESRWYTLKESLPNKQPRDYGYGERGYTNINGSMKPSWNEVASKFRGYRDKHRREVHEPLWHNALGQYYDFPKKFEALLDMDVPIPDDGIEDVPLPLFELTDSEYSIRDITYSASPLASPEKSIILHTLEFPTPTSTGLFCTLPPADGRIHLFLTSSIVPVSFNIGLQYVPPPPTGHDFKELVTPTTPVQLISKETNTVININDTRSVSTYVTVSKDIARIHFMLYDRSYFVTARAAHKNDSSKDGMLCGYLTTTWLGKFYVPRGPFGPFGGPFSMSDLD